MNGVQTRLLKCNSNGGRPSDLVGQKKPTGLLDGAMAHQRIMWEMGQCIYGELGDNGKPWADWLVIDDLKDDRYVDRSTLAKAGGQGGVTTCPLCLPAHCANRSQI